MYTSDGETVVQQSPRSDGQPAGFQHEQLLRSDDGSDPTNSVSLLQEYIQSRSSFSVHSKILTWSFEQQLENDNTLQFKATVSCTFSDVPHHFCGDWQSSKKKAQRDAAERVRRFLRKRRSYTAQNGLPPAGIEADALSDMVTEELIALRSHGDLELHGRVASSVGAQIEEISESCGYRVLLSFPVQGVPHQFAGSWFSSKQEATCDTAERVLWYFGKGKEAFVPDRNALRQLEQSRQHAAAPAATGPRLGKLLPGTVDEKSKKAVEEKTLLMQVQNALQKTFSKGTPPGQRVWEWDYEPDSRDPQTFRAIVTVPHWEKTFTGAWCKGKKQAQRSTCLIVKSFLESVNGQ